MAVGALFVLLLHFMLSAALAQGKPFEFLQNLQGARKGETVKGVYQLKQYLKRFGYLHYDSNHATHANNDEFDELLESAVKTYQLSYNLNVTGTLDSQTVKEMMKPRCGVPDIINTKLQHGPRSVDAGSKFSFFPGNPRWPADKYHLVYTFLRQTLVVDIQILRPIISDAFRRWAAVSRFTFAEAELGSVYDISVGFRRIDGPNKIIAYSYAPTTGIFDYDASEKWSNGSPRFDQYDLESIAVHEIGHLLGLGHCTDPKAIMYATIDEGVRKVDLQDDDIRGIRTLYGW